VKVWRIHRAVLTSAESLGHSSVEPGWPLSYHLSRKTPAAYVKRIYPSLHSPPLSHQFDQTSDQTTNTSKHDNTQNLVANILKVTFISS